MKRRQFLGLGLQSAGLLSIGFPAISAVADASPDFVQQVTLVAFIDTLIPEDETPSASQLGLDNWLLNHAKTIENYTALLALGCKWLDAQAKTLEAAPFSRLPEARRQQLVTLAEVSPPGTIARQFFDHARADLFDAYYTHPAIWPGLGLSGAPQPMGYLDYRSAPAKAASPSKIHSPKKS